MVGISREGGQVAHPDLGEAGDFPWIPREMARSKEAVEFPSGF